MEGGSGGVIHWKKLWQLTAGFNNESTTEFVSEQLSKVQQQLERGLLYYKPRSSKSLEKLRNEKIKTNLRLKNLLERLEKFLNIDAMQMWEVLCYYLVTEFRGSPTALSNFTLTEMKIVQLMIDIWGFYTSERMFMLKLLGVIIEYQKDEAHPYCNEYKALLKKVSLKRIRKSLIEQLENLIKETVPNSKENGDICTPYIQNLWVERNMREQIQILHLLILIVEEDHIPPSELELLLILFKEHNFGRQPSYEYLLTEKHVGLIKRISYFEVVLFLLCVDVVRFKLIDMNKWIDRSHKSLDSIIVTLHFSEEHSAFLLSWMLFNIEFQGEEIYHARYSQFGNKALQLNVFGFLYNIVTNTAFKDKSKLSIIAYKTIYNLLSDLCNKFDCDGSVSQRAYIFELSAELLSSKHIAQMFFNDRENGLNSVWNYAMELFPYEFVPLSIMAEGLTRCDGKYHMHVLKQLNHLSLFTEQYDPYKVRALPIEQGSEEYIIQEAHFPLSSVDFTIAPQTSAVIRDQKNKTLIHYRVNINYWTVLHSEIIQLLEGSLSGSTEEDCSLIRRVESGVKLMASCYKRIKDPNNIPERLVMPTEMVFDIILKFMRPVDNPPVELLTYCLEVFVNLIPLFGKEVQKRLGSSNLLPTINNVDLTYMEYVNGDCFQSNGIGYYLINAARSTGKYQLIMAYFNLLTTFFNLDTDNIMDIELPGLIFILREVFPHISTWHFNNELERQNILYHCMQYFLNILQLSQEQIATNKNQEILHKTCLLSLLNIQNGTALLRLIAVGNPYLQAVMEEQTNWVAGPGIQRIRLVQLAIATLMQILRLKSLVLNKNALAPLEYVIYTQPRQKDTLRIIPTVTGYMNHVFNKHLPSLACRLLKRFALEIQMSLMACLDMEPDQIRQLFLQRLRDESENEDLKTAILELVAACVERQPGLTEAFFKVYHPQDKSKVFYRPQGLDIAEGVLSYMAEYLSVVHKDPVRLSSPLLCRIMNLFHALWKNHMEMLVSDFRKETNFWKYFTSPLFHKIRPDIKAYSQILNIISIEMYQNHGHIDTNLKNSLERLFDPKSNHLKGLLEHIFNLPSDPPLPIIDETPEWLCLLTSWKDFITISVRLSPIEFTESQKQCCLYKCLETLIPQLRSMNDPRIVILLSELCLVMLSRWKNCIKKTDHTKLARQTITLMHATYLSYECLHVRAKEAMLAAIIHLIQSLEESFKINESLSNPIIESICQIICLEMNATEIGCKTIADEKMSMITEENAKTNSQEEAPKVDHEVLSCVLSFSLLNQVLSYYKYGLQSWMDTFANTCLINRILTCLNIIIPHYSKRKIILSALDTLMHLAKGVFSTYIINFDLSQYLWLSLLPPKNLMKDPNLEQYPNTWRVKDWWLVYRSGIDFVRIILEQNSKAFSLEAIVFVSVQEEFIVDSILLPRHSLEPESIQLTIASLQFTDELLKHEVQWRNEHESSLSNVMRAVQTIADYSISLIHRPRMLRCHIDGVTAESKPSEKVVTIVNRLLDIIALAARCLNAFSPSVLSLLTEDGKNITKWQPIVEMQFGAPKLDSLPNSGITFGTIMSAVCLFTKILNYTFKAKGKFLNRLTGPIDRSDFEDYMLNEQDFDKESFLAKKTVQRIQPSSEIANLTTGGSSILSTDWLMKFNTKHTLFALENLMTFLASQALFLMRDPNISSRDQQLVRRELSSELSTYHEFVRKKVLFSTKNILCRRKLGKCPLGAKSADDLSSDASSSDEDENTRQTEIVPPPPARRSTDHSMRVGVVRKQHLDASRTSGKSSARKSALSRMPITSSTPGYQGGSFITSTVVQPVAAVNSVENLLSGLQGLRSVSDPSNISPNKLSPGERPSLDLTNIPKHTMWLDDATYSKSPGSASPQDESLIASIALDTASAAPSVSGESTRNNETITMLPPEKDSERYYPLTDVLMYEEDYLHFLSYLFTYIFPMDSY